MNLQTRYTRERQFGIRAQWRDVRTVAYNVSCTHVPNASAAQRRTGACLVVRREVVWLSGVNQVERLRRPRDGISRSPSESYAPKTAAPANRRLEYLRHRSEYLRHFRLFGEDTRMTEAD